MRSAQALRLGARIRLRGAAPMSAPVISIGVRGLLTGVAPVLDGARLTSGAGGIRARRRPDREAGR